MIKWVQLEFQNQRVQDFMAVGITLVSNAVHVIYFHEKIFLFILLCLLCNYKLAMSIETKTHKLSKSIRDVQHSLSIHGRLHGDYQCLSIDV
jgi:hypothetical protein